MTFEEWLETEPLTGITNDDYMSAWLGWIAGQQAERERIKQIIDEVGWKVKHDAWLDCLDELMERIEQ